MSTITWSVFDEAERIGRKMEVEGHSFKDRINVYACTPSPITGEGGCGYWIVTIDRAPGVTPMFTKCEHCGGTASSRMYKVGDGLEPTHEWFRPASASELPVGYTLLSVDDHLRNGGLLLRPIGDGKWLEPTPATIALVESERQMFAGLRANTAPMSRQQRRYAERKARP